MALVHVDVIETEHGDEQITRSQVIPGMALRGRDYTTGHDRNEAPRDPYTGEEVEL